MVYLMLKYPQLFFSGDFWIIFFNLTFPEWVIIYHNIIFYIYFLLKNRDFPIAQALTMKVKLHCHYKSFCQIKENGSKIIFFSISFSEHKKHNHLRCPSVIKLCDFHSQINAKENEYRKWVKFNDEKLRNGILPEIFQCIDSIIGSNILKCCFSSPGRYVDIFNRSFLLGWMKDIHILNQ